MKLIKPSVEWLPQEPTLEGAKKIIEIAGRTCYKSEHLITEESSEKFYNRMLNYDHGSVLEHGTIYLALPVETLIPVSANRWYKYHINPFSSDPVLTEINGERKVAVTTNLRVIIENEWQEDLQYICEPSKYHDKRYTFRIISSRIISQQFTRHRVMSPSQESQRYCNYSKGKFNNEIQFLYPIWYENCTKKAIQLYTAHMIHTEKTYFGLLKEGLLAEDARDALINGVKTEFVYTGFKSDFIGNFHKLRSHKSAQKLIRLQEKEIYDIIQSDN